MELAAILALVNGALSLAETGSAVYAFLQGIQSRIAAAQAGTGQLTTADYAYLLNSLALAHAALQGKPAPTLAPVVTPAPTALPTASPTPTQPVV